jgi:hypothetical protein
MRPIVFKWTLAIVLIALFSGGFYIRSLNKKIKNLEQAQKGNKALSA